MTDKEIKWIKFSPSLELPKERVSIAYDTHDDRKIRYAYGYFQFHNGTCSSFWKDGNETPKVVKIEDIRYWMPVPSFDSLQEEPKKCMYALDDFNDEDRKVTCDGCEEDCKYNKKETVNDKLGGINNAIIQDKLIWQNNIKHDCSFCSMPDCAGRNSSAKDNCLLNRKKEPSIPDIVDEHFYEMLGEEPVSEDNNLRKASEEYLKVLSETPYNNTPITNAQTIVRELITFLDNPSKYNPNHIEEYVSEDLDEAAFNYAEDCKYEGGEKLLCVEHFKTGAKWQKEQMMKDAVDACVTDIRIYKEENEVDFTVMYEKGIIPYEIEQEVKVIVITED